MRTEERCPIDELSSVKMLWFPSFGTSRVARQRMNERGPVDGFRKSGRLFRA
jgi:hypothetical protein